MTDLSLRIWPDMAQRSEAWFKARAGRPTASQFSRILTPEGKPSASQRGYALELIAESLVPAEIESGFYGNKHTDRGNELEPEAISCFESVMNLNAVEAGFITCDDGIIGCSPDSLVTKEIGGDYMAGLEIKAPLAKNHVKYLAEGKLPRQYKLQVHGSIAVTGLDFWYFMSYHQRLKPFIVRVERDDFTEQVSKELDNFVMYYSGLRRKLIPELRKEGI